MKGKENIRRILQTMAASLAVGTLVMAMAIEAPAFQPPKPSATPKPTPKPKPKPKPKPVEIFTVNGVTFEMVRVEGGSFQMGSNNEDDHNEMHKERVGTFYIGQTEVTQALWEAVMGENPSNIVGDDLPVENVSWYDCQEFIKHLNRMTGRTFRLPSEVEWEFAARGGKHSKGYIYSGSDDLNMVGWYEENSDSTSHPVGQKLSNELGLFDMSGNVWEWCDDMLPIIFRFSSDAFKYYFRGGSWGSPTIDCSVTRNRWIGGESVGNLLGLRLAF